LIFYKKLIKFFKDDYFKENVQVDDVEEEDDDDKETDVEIEPY